MDGQLNLVDVACRKRGAACTGGFLSDFERVDPNSRNLLARATDRLILGGGGSPLPLPSSVQLLPAARVRGWPQADRPRCPATVMKLSEKKKRWAGMVSRVGWTQWECEWNVNRRVEKEGGGRLCSLFLRRRLLSDSILTGVLCVSLLAQTLPTALGKRSFGEGFVGWVYY